MLRDLVQQLHHRLEQVVHLKFRGVLEHDDCLRNKIGNALVKQLWRAIYRGLKVHQYRFYKICVVGVEFACALGYV